MSGSIEITTPTGATNAVTTTLSGTASGLVFGAVDVFDNGSLVGGAGVYNGAWSAVIAPNPGDNAYTVTGLPQTDPGASSNAVVLTDVRTPPTVAVAQAGGNTDATVQTLSGSATTAGYGARFTAGTILTLSDDGTAVGQATVAADGTWSAQVTLPNQGNNAITVSDTDALGNSGEAVVGFALKTSVPAVAITSLGDTAMGPVHVISGTATAGDVGDTITVFQDGSAIGTAAVAPDGTWGLVAPLAAGTHSFQATDADGYGNVGTSNALAYTLSTAPPAPPAAAPAPTPPAIAFGPAPQLGGTTATLTGTVSDAVGITRLEVFDGTTDLGAATVGSDGTWAFSHDFGQGSYDHLTAVATDPAGLSTAATASYDLDTGVSGKRYAGMVETTDASGSVTGVTTFAADGGIGSQTTRNPDGTATATAYENGQALFSIGGDVMTGTGFRENFVFQPNMGHVRVTDFVAAGRGHDTLTLSHADFDDLGQLLAHTTMSGGYAVIHVTPADTIRLAGVTKADLVAHKGDFAFGP